MAATIPNDHFKLQWNNFTSDVSNAFRQLREDSDFCDVTLGCSDSKGNSLKAHKVILSASSEKFRQILREDYSQKEHPNPYIYFKGIGFSDLKLMLDFIYNGEVTLAKDHLKSFLKVAKELEIRALCKTSGTNKETKPNDTEKSTTESKDAADSKKPKKKDDVKEGDNADSDLPQPPPAKSPKTDDADKEEYPVTESPPRIDPETGMVPKSPERIDPETGFIPEDQIVPTPSYNPEETLDSEAKILSLIPKDNEEPKAELKNEEEANTKPEEAQSPPPERRLELPNSFIPRMEAIMKEPENHNSNPYIPNQLMEESKAMIEDPTPPPPPPPTEEINIFKCRLCEYECAKPKLMRHHLKNEHANKINTQKQNGNTSNQGERDANNNLNKRDHEGEGVRREKKNDINCKDCFRLSGNIQALEMHVKEAHIKNKLRITSDMDM